MFGVSAFSEAPFSADAGVPNVATLSSNFVQTSDGVRVRSASSQMVGTSSSVSVAAGFVIGTVTMSFAVTQTANAVGLFSGNRLMAWPRYDPS